MLIPAGGLIHEIQVQAGCGVGGRSVRFGIGRRLAAVARAARHRDRRRTRICPSAGAPPRTSRGRRGLGGRRRVVADRRPAIASSSRRRSAPAFGVRATIRGSRRAATRDGAGERALARQGAAADDRTFFVVEAFNRADGRRLWEYRVEAAGPLPGVHDKHNLASPSPVTDGQMVYAWFGTGQIVALDMNGKLVWQRHLGKEISPFDINWGHSSSPTLYRGLADPAVRSRAGVVSARGRQADRQGAVEGRSRPGAHVVHARRSSSTRRPGRSSIVNSSERVDAYDPRTGAFLWHVGGRNQFPIPVPTFHDGVIYMSRGYRSGPYMAIRPGGRGDITDVARRLAGATPARPTSRRWSTTAG